MNEITFPHELINHIFIYCQGSTNKIMKDHIDSVKEYKYYHEETNLPYILYLMNIYNQIYFNKEKFHSRFYRCVNCSRVGYFPPRIEFGEKFCSYTCADQFDY